MHYYFMQINILNRRAFLVIAFLVCYALVDIFDSVTAFPILHYGMFSGQFARENIKLFKIKVNDKILVSDSFNISEWDLIHSPLQTFQRQMETKDFKAEKAMYKRMLQKINIGSSFDFIKRNLDNRTSLQNDFPVWYKNFLSEILHYKIVTLEIDLLDYNYVNGRYMEMSKNKWINL